MGDMLAIEWAVGVVSVFLFTALIWMMSKGVRLNEAGAVMLFVSATGSIFTALRLIGVQ